MNQYQNIMHNISLSETAKKRILYNLQSEWNKAHSEQFLRKKKLIAGLSVVTASIVGICAITIPIGIHSLGNSSERLKVYEIGINTLYSDDNGTFCWKEIAYAKTILSKETLYESSRAGFIIVKAEFNFASYQLKKCGITLYDRLGPYPRQGNYYRINYYQNEGGEYWCDIKNDGDLNLDITQSLSTDLNIYKEPKDVRGTAFLCFEIDNSIFDYLIYMHTAELNDEEYRSSQDVNLEINDIWKKEKYCRTDIGCSFAEISFYDSYKI